MSEYRREPRQLRLDVFAVAIPAQEHAQHIAVALTWNST
jgi:hypothetical protein